jgi:hypothetical protein
MSMSEQVSWSPAASGPGLIELAGSVRVVEPPGSDIHVAYGVGLRHPIDSGASGAVILAALPPTRGECAAGREARGRFCTGSRSELEECAYGVSAGVSVADLPAVASGGIISLRTLDDGVVRTDLRTTADATTDALSVSLRFAPDQSRRQGERRDCD